jgi:hypothetical protein
MQAEIKLDNKLFNAEVRKLYSKELFDQQNAKIWDDTLLLSEITADDTIVCTICCELIVSPHESDPCGHIFCHKCVAKLTDKPCPNCRGDVKAYNKLNYLCRKNENLRVKCIHAESGCTEKFTLKDINAHLSKCLYHITACDKGCGEYIKRMMLPKHYFDCPHRLVNCDKCNELTVYIRMNDHLTNYCNERMTKCFQHCGETIKAKHFDYHKKKCPNTIVKCHYYEICGESMKRCDLQEHENDLELHVDLALAVVNSLKINPSAAELEEKAKCKLHRICGMTGTNLAEHEKDSMLHIKTALGLLQDLRQRTVPKVDKGGESIKKFTPVYIPEKILAEINRTKELID